MTLSEDAPTGAPPGGHHRTTSSLGDFTMLEIDRGDDNVTHIKEQEVEEGTVIPQNGLLLFTDADHLKQEDTVEHKLVENWEEWDFDDDDGQFNVKDWDGKLCYSDLIAKGMKYVKRGQEKVIMLFVSAFR